MAPCTHAYPLPPLIPQEGILEIIADNPLVSVWDVVALAYPAAVKQMRGGLRVRVCDQILRLRRAGLIEVVGIDSRRKEKLYAVPHSVKMAMASVQEVEQW